MGRFGQGLRLYPPIFTGDLAESLVLCSTAEKKPAKNILKRNLPDRHNRGKRLRRPPGRTISPKVSCRSTLVPYDPALETMEQTVILSVFRASGNKNTAFASNSKNTKFHMAAHFEQSYNKSYLCLCGTGLMLM